MRLIDADALLKQLRKNPLFERTEQDRGMFYVERSCIDAMPTIDAVPVVRCKDYHYGDEAKVNEKGFLICPASCMEITDNDFCSYGERRSDEV